jgi:uncharacterized protein (DUF58 family)
MWRRRRESRAARPSTPTTGGRPESPDGLLRRLQWTVLRPLAAHLGGDERSLMRGPGMELAELREYQPGDDVRHIDWNTTARADRPFVREAYAERALDAWLLVDLSASVDWGTAQCLKRDRSIELVALGGYLLGRHGNRVGALYFADRPLGVVQPASGRTHLLQVLARLGSEPSRAGSGPTDLAAALRQAQTLVRRRSFILVVSDFLAPDGWQTILGQLAHRHEVVAARLTDPRETELPDVGLITLEDPETGVQLTVDTSDRGLRRRFADAAAAQSERIRTDLNAVGVDQLVVGTDSGLLPALVRFLQARRRRRTTAPAARIRTAASSARPAM